MSKEKLKVGVFCEESQVVCKAFRERGHEAYSIDLQDCSGGHPEWHIKTDVREMIGERFDLIVFHPVCKYIANSGVRWLDDILRRDQRIEDLKQACEFFNLRHQFNSSKVAPNITESQYRISKTLKTAIAGIISYA